MEESFLTSFGQRIKAMRLKNDLTQSELAEKMGYSEKSSIARIEHGQVDLPASKVEEFSNVLHCSITYLMGWEEKPAAKQSDAHVDDALLKRLLAYMKFLNPKGIDELLKRAGELVQLPQYSNKDQGDKE